MFGKCIKHEFRAMQRSLLPLCIAMPVMSFMISILLVINGKMINEESATLSMFTGLFAILLGFALSGIMIAISVVSFVMIIKRFHTSFFTDEGYLSFTLPVTMDMHILSKLTVAMIWSAITVLDAILCGALIGGGAVLGYGLGSELTEILAEFGEVFSMMGDIVVDNVGAGMSVAYTVISVLTLVIEAVGSVLVLYLAIAMASMLVKKNRFIVGLVVYWGVGFVFSTLNEIVTLIVGYAEMPADVSLLVVGILMLALTALRAVGSYIGTKWVMEKKMNLD